MADAAALHELAVQAEGAVEQLATDLAHAGVDPSAVKEVSQCAAILRGVVQALGAAPEAAPAPGPAQGGQDLGSAVGQFHQSQVAAAQNRG